MFVIADEAGTFRRSVEDCGNRWPFGHASPTTGPPVHLTFGNGASEALGAGSRAKGTHPDQTGDISATVAEELGRLGPGARLGAARRPVAIPYPPAEGESEIRSAGRR